MGKTVDMTGNKYVRLTAIEIVGRTKCERKYLLWRFICDCGNDIITRGADVRSGRTKSCGCLVRENAISILDLAHAAATRHGKSHDPIYKIWYGMKGRCYTKSNTGYPRYGAKGITVCDEWRDNPQVFIEWAMNNGYQKGLSIDRIDGTKGYYPDNCRFVTQKEQMRNVSNNVWVMISGKRKILADLAKETGLHRDTIQYRLNRGLSPEEAITC